MGERMYVGEKSYFPKRKRVARKNKITDRMGSQIWEGTFGGRIWRSLSRTRAISAYAKEE